MYKSTFLVIFFLVINTQCYAQTFKAGVFAGLTASQINGDDTAGFNKAGLEGGLRIGVDIQDKMELSLELQYSQRGARQEVQAGIPQAIYRTDYIAVPVIFSYRDWAAEEYYKLHFHGGLSYGRLVNAELDNEEADNSVFLNLWRENDLSILAGATYFLNKHFGLTVRYNRSLILLYKNTDENAMNGGQGNSLAPYNLSFHAVYMF